MEQRRLLHQARVLGLGQREEILLRAQDRLTDRSDERRVRVYYHFPMAFPIKVCAICGEEFELRPGKPGFANRCPECSVEDEAKSAAKGLQANRQVDSELNAERKRAIRDLLYRKDS